MTDCRAVIRRLWEFLDGEVPQSEAEEIRAHLAKCAHCNPQYKFQLGFLRALLGADAAREPLRAEFVRRLESALDNIGDDLT